MNKSLGMYSCQEASRLISDALERKLAPTERLRLRLHLVFCKMCRDYEQNIHMLESTLSRLNDLDSVGEKLSEDEKIHMHASLKAILGNDSESNDS